VFECGHGSFEIKDYPDFLTWAYSAAISVRTWSMALWHTRFVTPAKSAGVMIDSEKLADGYRNSERKGRGVNERLFVARLTPPKARQWITR
jgi:hypothetical protein